MTIPVINDPSPYRPGSIDCALRTLEWAFLAALLFLLVVVPAIICIRA